MVCRRSDALNAVRPSVPNNVSDEAGEKHRFCNVKCIDLPFDPCDGAIDLLLEQIFKCTEQLLPSLNDSDDVGQLASANVIGEHLQRPRCEVVERVTVRESVMQLLSGRVSWVCIKQHPNLDLMCNDFCNAGYDLQRG